MRLFEGTEFDRPPTCERCSQVETDCQCPPEAARRIPPEKQTARLAIEKRRKGKVVTVVRGLPEEGNDLQELLTRLKSGCGAGGSIQDGEIEIQARQLERVRELLETIGFKVKG